MPRSIWNGVISFGMVSIPVRLFTGTESKDIAFNTLHSVCNTRLKQMRWCPNCEREVPYEEVDRGYEYSKGQYVKITDEDFEGLPVPSKHTIDVDAFIKLPEIDPVYFENSYYLEPEEAGKKPFALFMKAVSEKNMVAIAKITIRKKEQLCALRPVGGTLVLETLHYADEIRVDMEKELGELNVSEQEMQMASTLIDLLAKPFDPEQYTDEYRESLKQLIEAKLEGREVVEAPAAPEAKVTNLMEALRASVEAARASKPAAEAEAEEEQQVKAG
jgi:DNA end-binding protein Ku